MDLTKIISIPGKSGLFTLISQAKNSFVVEDVEKKVRFSISLNNQVNLLDNIAIYTYEEDVPLREVFQKIADAENYQNCINFKESSKNLRAYMEKVFPEYDKERVYDSDLKKLFKWYNLLLNTGLISSDNKVITQEIKSEVTQEEE